MRYTRQLATAALIVAAGLGLGACSAHPGAAIVTSSGSYSTEDVNEAVQQMGLLTGQQAQISADQIRTALLNEPILAAAASSVGTTVSDEQVDQTVDRVLQAQGLSGLTLGHATRATVRSILLEQTLNGLVQSDPSIVAGLNDVMTKARESAKPQVNPRFRQPSQGGKKGSAVPMFGDAVAGNQQGGTSALQGGSTTGGSSH